MKTDCKGVLGHLLGHNYQPRFNEHVIPPTRMNTKATYAFPSDMVAIIKAATEIKRTYIGDVCTRCGDPIPPFTDK